MLNLQDIRSQFPILSTKIGSEPLVYLDSAATSQKPQAVLKAMDEYYTTQNGNAHRGMHPLAEAATQAFEGARESVRTFINAEHAEEVIFTKSCTEAINLVAKSLSVLFQPGDAVVTTILEHHANIVPWQQLQERGVHVLFLDCDDEGKLRLDQLSEFVKKHSVKLVTVTMQSNVLGVRPDVKMIIDIAHKAGALVLIDAAQAVAHGPVDVRDLDCDFLTFSAHKMYGPLGIGVLYGKKEMLQKMPPYLGGGMMIREVTTKGFTPADLPLKFEAGTQPIAEAVGLRAAIEWLKQFDPQEIRNHEATLILMAHQALSLIPGLKILGPHPSELHGCISFVIEGIHPHDLTDILGQRGICMRAGHHCTQPLHKRFGIPASTRLSVGIYNTMEEIAEAVGSIDAFAKKWRGK